MSFYLNVLVFFVFGASPSVNSFCSECVCILPGLRSVLSVLGIMVDFLIGKIGSSDNNGSYSRSSAAS